MASITLSKPDGSSVHFTPIGTNALCALEEELQKGFGAILVELGVFGEAGLKLTTARRVLQLAASDDLSIEDIGTLMDQHGFEYVAQIVNLIIAPLQARELVHG